MELVVLKYKGLKLHHISLRAVKPRCTGLLAPLVAVLLAVDSLKNPSNRRTEIERVENVERAQLLTAKHDLSFGKHISAPQAEQV